MRQRAGGFTAIDGLRAQRVCADIVQDVRRQRSGNAQTTEVIERRVGAQCALGGRATGVWHTHAYRSPTLWYSPVG